MPFSGSSSDKLRLGLLTVLLSLAAQASANGVWARIKRVDFPHVRLAVGWEHGWGSYPQTQNHDAVWLFAKELNANGGGYSSLKMETISIAAGSFKDSLPADGVGAFLIPTHQGGFRRDSCEVEITFSSGLLPAEFQIHALEMVYVPAASFYLGDGASQFSFLSKADSTPILVEGNSPLRFGTDGEITHLNYTPPAFDLGTDWPQGVKGFYMMKHEVSQLQYLDFFNSLSRAQREAIWASRGSSGNRFALDEEGHRNNLIKDQNGFLTFEGNSESADPEKHGLLVGCNYLNWDDLLAWLDWAGLRPVTELEFEKACRGPLLPKPKEFAWGTQKANNITALVQAGFTEEAPANSVSSTESGNAVFGALLGQPYLNAPVRQNFAATDNTTRIGSGAGYYGAFELSGSLWEMCVKACPEAVTFTANPGDGELDLQGSQNQGWPSASGAITRGGGCNSLILNNLIYAFRDLAVSDRFYYTLRPDQRMHTVGGRGGR